jgi:hypothetical protein
MMRPAAPIIIGISVWTEFQEYITPPQVAGMRNDVEPPTKRKVPT